MEIRWYETNMRILLINYEFPPLGGGAGNATQNIARELSRAGHNVLVLTTWFSGLSEDEMTEEYRVIRVKSKRARVDRSNVFEMFHFAWRAVVDGRDVAKEFKPDATISFFAIPSGLVAWYFKKKFGVPYVVSLRGGDVPGFLPENLRWHHIFSAPLTTLVWKNAAHIVANSEGLRILADKTALRYGKKVTMIPNGVDRELFSTRSESASSNTTKILFVGRLTEQKGVTYIIDAVNEILKKRNDLKGSLVCSIIGDGPLRGVLEEKVKGLGLGDSIIFHGWVPREKLPTFYQNADVFVLPSSDEGMPNVVLEAMASGLPIITTFVPGSEELVVGGENGMLVKDRTELTPAMLDFLDNREKWQAMGRASLERSKKFDWVKIAGEYISLI